MTPANDVWALKAIRDRALHLRKMHFDRPYCEGWMRAYISKCASTVPENVWMRELDAILNGPEPEPDARNPRSYVSALCIRSMHGMGPLCTSLQSCAAKTTTSHRRCMRSHSGACLVRWWVTAYRVPPWKVDCHVHTPSSSRPKAKVKARPYGVLSASLISLAMVGAVA